MLSRFLRFLNIWLFAINCVYANVLLSHTQGIRTGNHILINKNYSNPRYYFTGIIVKNKLTLDVHAKRPDDYYVTLVALHYQTNTTIVIDKCKKKRGFTKSNTRGNVKTALKYRKRFPIGQPVIWKRKRIGGKC